MPDVNIESLVSKAPFGYAYHKIILDHEGKPSDYEFIDVNPVFERLTGLKAADILHNRISKVIPGITKDTFDWIGFYGEVALNGDEKEFEQFSESLKRWYSVMVYSPERHYFITIFTDITERKRTERLQSLSNTILRVLSSNINLKDLIDGILKAIQRETKFSAVGIRLRNGVDYPYFLQNGFSEDFLLTENALTVKGNDGGVCKDENGNVLLECTCGMVISAKKDQPNPLLTSGGSFWTNDSFPLLDIPVEEDLRLHPRNTCIHMGYGSVALIPIRANENIVGLLQLNEKEKGVFTEEMIEFYEGICLTIGTAMIRKQAEQEIILKNGELLKLNAEKDKFFSIIAHDLRSPFNTFLGLTKMIAESDSLMDLDKIKEIAKMMKNSATNLYSLLENLLEWAQSQKGETSFSPSSLGLTQVIEKNAALIKESASKKEIKITYEIPEDLVVFADDNMLGCIIRNLCFNAVKFTPKGGKISLAARTISGDKVEISVTDSGIGMKQEILTNLFKSGNATSRKGTAGEPSTGLGLILCEEFAEKNGGKIWVESEEGKGSTFYFTLSTKQQVNS